MLFFMLTNIFTENTELLFVGKDAKLLVQKAFDVEDIDGDSIILNNVVSRKKQVIPMLINASHE